MFKALAMAMTLSSYPTIGAQLMLEVDMPMAAVEKIMGIPDGVEQMTCGSSTPKPWQCRVWKYETDYKTFRVTFARYKDGWFVNSWG